jgi:polar amino acid transport system substrate-binding protein
MSPKGRVVIATLIALGVCSVVLAIIKFVPSRHNALEHQEILQDSEQDQVGLTDTSEGDSQDPTPLLITTSMTSPLSKVDMTGFYDQILIEAFRRAELPIRIAHLPTERSITNADLGITDGEFPRISGLESLYPNLIRVPEKIDDFEFVVFTWRNDIQIEDWDSLKPYNVAIVKGWKILEANLADVHSLVSVNNQQNLFTLLGEHRTDMVVYSRFEGQEMIETLGLDSIRILEPPLATREMFLYLNKKNLAVVSEIEEQLRNMKLDGTYDRILDETLGPYMEDAAR